MTRTKNLSLAGEVIRIDQSLLTSLKSIRSLAEKCRVATSDAAAKEQLEKYLARPHPLAKRTPPKVKQEKPTEAERRHLKTSRLLDALSEEQLRIVTEVAKSMTREVPNRKRIASTPKESNATPNEKDRP